MSDYGHDLLFGSFVTPTNADPQVPVGLAGRGEAAGLDLVTFQDHPYQPAFLDTWTLLTWVAAQTERIRLSRQRAQPAAAPAGGAGARRGEPRPALAAGGSSSGWARARSGTRSRRWAAAG